SLRFRSIPHEQVVQVVTLGSSSQQGNDTSDDLGPANAPDDAGVTPPSLPDLATVRDLAAPPDLTPPPPGTIAKDDFQRPNQPLWGKASDGQTWGAAANTSNTFAIVNKTGQITDVNGNADSAVLGPVATNAEVLVTTTLNTFTNNSETGPLLR